MFREPDIYSRMETQLRGRTGRPPRLVALEAAVIVLLIFSLGYLLYVAQFSGSVRWILGFVIVAVLAISAWLAVARRTSEPSPLARPQPVPRPQIGELSNFTATVKRADAGLMYSQVAVSSRLRDAFVERVRLGRGLSAEAVRRLQADPGALGRAFRDPVLEDFLFLPTADSEERYRWVLASRARGGFPRSVNDVLDHMEAWR